MSAGLHGAVIKDEAAALHLDPPYAPGARVPTRRSSPSPCFGTQLDERLRQDGVDAIAITGLTTDHCCSTTARMAANLGFETWLLDDALATFPREAPDGELIPAEDVHRTELAILNGEFAEVVDVARALERLARRLTTPRPSLDRDPPAR